MVGRILLSGQPDDKLFLVQTSESSYFVYYGLQKSACFTDLYEAMADFSRCFLHFAHQESTLDDSSN
jgi:hypothetical protein